MFRMLDRPHQFKTVDIFRTTLRSQSSSASLSSCTPALLNPQLLGSALASYRFLRNRKGTRSFSFDNNSFLLVEPLAIPCGTLTLTSSTSGRPVLILGTPKVRSFCTWARCRLAGLLLIRVQSLVLSLTLVIAVLGWPYATQDLYLV